MRVIAREWSTGLEKEQERHKEGERERKRAPKRKPMCIHIYVLEVGVTVNTYT